MALGTSPQGPEPRTFFAPPERAAEEELRVTARACLEHPAARFFIQAAGGLVLILDAHRQVLAVNEAVAGALGNGSPPPFGRRPGELFGCIHADEGPAGCGTSKACQHCGAVLTVLECQRTLTPIHGECTLTLRHGGRLEAVEFSILASPLQVGPHRLIAVVLQDQSAAKRREALERLFFHDVANLMQGIRGWTELIAEGGISSQAAAAKLMRLTDLLDRELRSHQDMARAESGHLKAEARAFRASEVLQDVRDLLDRHPASRQRRIQVDPGPDPLLTTDSELLSRVILNMAVNAMEATPEGAEITLAVQLTRDGCRLVVWNPGEIPPEYRSRIFQRSFSTKGTSGRGLGTYAMKLFGENVLGGRVGFTCAGGETAFHIDLPVTAG